MKKILIAILLASAVTGLAGCGNEKVNSETAHKESKKVENVDVEKNENENKEEKTEKTISFAVKEALNISEYEVVDSKKADMNLDKIEDEILFLKHKTKAENDKGKKVLLINDGKIKEQLTYSELGVMDILIGDIYDFSKDGIPEIILETSTGGTAGGSARVIGNVNGEFGDIEFENMGTLIVENFDGFKVRVREEKKNTFIEKIISGDVKNSLSSDMVYDLEGNFIHSWNKWERNIGGAILEDIDGDGVKEIILESYITGIANAEEVINVQSVYKYNKGKFEALGLLQKDGERTFKTAEIDESKIGKYAERDEKAIEAAKQTLIDMNEAKEGQSIEYEYVEEMNYKGTIYYRFYRHVTDEHGSTTGDCSLLVKKDTDEVFYNYALQPVKDMQPFVPQ